MCPEVYPETYKLRELGGREFQEGIPGGIDIKEKDKSRFAFWTLEFPAYLPNSAPRTLKQDIYSPKPEISMFI